MFLQSSVCSRQCHKLPVQFLGLHAKWYVVVFFLHSPEEVYLRKLAPTIRIGNHTDNLGAWSSEGCNLRSGENVTDENVVCVCHHLTHFGFLAVSFCPKVMATVCICVCACTYLCVR